VADDLERRATAARAVAEEAERARIAANEQARNLAAEAFQLERELEARELRRYELELGPSRSASINVTASTAEELAAAREAGHVIPSG
jgi:hypothetical protein